MGDMAYIPAEAPTWTDMARHQRVWLMVEDGRQDDAIAALPQPWRVEGQARHFGSVSLLLATRGQDKTRWDALGGIEQAAVSRDYGQRTEQCNNFQSGRWPTWHCKRRDPFLFVGEVMRSVTNDTHRCLWAHPIADGGRLVIGFDKVPAGGGVLTGHYGQPIDAIRSDRGAPVNFEVLVEGEVVHRKTFGVHEEGFGSWSVPLPTDKANVAVTFAVQTASQNDRRFCFTARSVAP